MTRVTQANVRPIFVRLALVGLSSESGSLHAAADFGAHFAKVFASVALAVTGTVAAPAVGRAAREQAVGVALVAGNFAARVTFHVGSPSLVSELDLEALADAGDEPTRRIPVAREDGPTWKGAAVRIVDVEQDCRRFVLLKPLDDFLTFTLASDVPQPYSSLIGSLRPLPFGSYSSGCSWNRGWLSVWSGSS